MTVSDRSPVRVGQAQGMGLDGLTGIPVTVDCDISRGLPGMNIVGLGDAAVIQARDRVRSAMINSGLRWPKSRVVVSLSPASVPKSGSGFDLPMVLAILVAEQVVVAQDARDCPVIGELGLDGSVRGVSGVLPMVLAARRKGCRRVAVPVDNIEEASRVTGVDVTGLSHLDQLVPWTRGESVGRGDPTPGAVDHSASATSTKREPDLLDVTGQPTARRGLEVAAAGGHHLWLCGPPGSGKSMLAQRLPGILPPLSDEEQLQAAAVHSVAGEKGDLEAIWRRLRPFVAPHPSVTLPALTGGGSGRIRPGAASLAHRGVLFLDEAPEVARDVLEGLRIPMESGTVAVERVRGTVVLPARFQLVMASNPCPCGAESATDCRCRGGVRDRYLQRISGPVRDRIDIVAATSSDRTASVSGGGEESSAVVRARVVAARDRSARRWSDAATVSGGGRPGAWRMNAEVSGVVLRRSYPAEDTAMAVLQDQLRRGSLSQRGVDRSLRVAWTLADLAGKGRPGVAEVLDAVDMFTGGQEERVS